MNLLYDGSLDDLFKCYKKKSNNITLNKELCVEAYKDPRERIPSFPIAKDFTDTLEKKFMPYILQARYDCM